MKKIILPIGIVILCAILVGVLMAITLFSFYSIPETEDSRSRRVGNLKVMEKVNQTTTPFQIPQDIIDKADAYLIRRTREEFFTKHIVNNPDHYSFVDHLVPGVEGWDRYSVAYKYSIPGVPDDNGFSIPVNLDGIVLDQRFSLSGIPSCSPYGDNCEVNIDAQQAIDLAVENGLRAENIEVHFRWRNSRRGFVFYLTDRIRANESRIIEIDATTGEIIMVEQFLSF